TSNTHQELLRVCWFPSTSVGPKSAVAFHVLEKYHLLLFESKVSSYEFYDALVQRTNNTGLTPPKWQHLKMLKCSGGGHDPEGIDATKQGECTILCPACPHPGKNFPPDWEKVQQFTFTGTQHGQGAPVDSAAA
ncbi:hypothetical protein BV22DRAFT_1023381, partial [Leucogyrophana mollusca]